MDNDSDLKKLDDNSLEDLVGFIKEDWPWSASAIGKIKQSQRSGGQLINLNVYVDMWPHPQLVILENLTYKRADEIKWAPLLIYARKMATEKIREKINSIPLLRRRYQEGYSEFQDTEYRIHNILKDASAQHDLQVHLTACPNVFTLCDESKLISSIPSGYTIHPLEQHHANTVNTNWKFGNSPQVLQRIRLWIEHSFSAGAFCSQTSELVAWGFVSEAGCISALATKEGHRRQGIAKAIITKLVRQAQKEGITPIAYIEEENVISESMFQKLGFRRIQGGQVAFFHIVP